MQGRDPVKIHIMRHAQSEANINEILAGQLDYPLTEKGKKDAEQIARWYNSRYSPSVIYCSPQIRAKQTAAPFHTSNSIPFRTDERLKEHNLGIFQGMTYSQVEGNPAYQMDKTRRWDWNIPEGESYRDIAKRIESFFSSIEPDHPDFLIVTHAVAMRLMKGVLENTLPIYPGELAKNGEIWELDFQGLGHSHTITSLFADSVDYEEHRS